MPPALGCKLYLLFVLMCLQWGNAFAQVPAPVTPRPVLPASPNAAGLGVYGNIPVGLFTGVPNVSVPVWELKSRQLRVPISLSYHSTGLQVDETASSTGLGWSLNAGGVISHTTFGLDDLGPNGYASGYTLLPPFTADPNFASVPNYVTAYGQDAQANNDAYYYCYQAAVNGVNDSEPDVYNYNLGGRSGRFVFDQQRTAHLIPYEAITVGFVGRDGLVLTDEKGVRYFFTAVETSELLYGNTCQPGFAQIANNASHSAYYLTLMVSPQQDSIHFSYGVESTAALNPLGTPQYDVKPGCRICEPIVASPCQTKTLTESRRIQEIRTSTGQRATFEYATDERRDLVGSHRLQRIRIWQGQEPVRSFELYHAYFTSPGSGSSDPLEQAAAFRLRLDSLREVGKPAHRFTYDHQQDPFPARFAFAQDKWGYFNNQPNASLLPALDFDDRRYPGANREPDSTAMRYGMLRTIRYPTGGTSEFAYEPHAYFFNDSLTTYHYRSKAVQAGARYPTAQNVTVTDTFTLRKKTAAEITYWIQQSSLGNTLVGGTASVELRGDAYQGFIATVPDKQTTVFQANPVFVLLPAGHYTLVVTTNATSTADENAFADAGLFVNLKIKDRTYVRNRQIGGCRIKRITDQTVGQLPTVTSYAYAQPLAPDASSGFITNEPVLFYDYIQTYLYAQTNESIWTHYLVRVPRSAIPTTAIQGGSVGYEAVTVTRGRQGEGGKTEYYYTSQRDLSGYQEYPFAPASSYDWVRGQLRRQIDYRQDVAAQRFLPVREVRHRYALQHTVLPIAFDLSGGTHPVHPNEALVRGVKIAVLRSPNVVTFGGSAGGQTVPSPVPYPAVYYYQPYRYTSAWQYLDQTIEYQFAPDDTARHLTSSTRYFYDNAQHIQPTRVQTVTSGGDTLWTYHHYPLDYDTTAATAGAARGIRLLARQHVLTPVVEQLQLRQRGLAPLQLVNGYVMEYDGLLPHRQQQLRLAAPLAYAAFQPTTLQHGQLALDSHYAPREHYDRYDASGNLLQVRLPAGTASSYVWSEVLEEPIAKVSNAAYSQVAYTGFEAAELGKWVPTGLGGAATGAGGYTGRASYRLGPGSGLQCAGLPAGTYQISCWARTGGGVPTANGLSLRSSGVERRGWQLCQANLALNALGTVTLAGSGQIDELRLAPVGAQMVTYTYQPQVGLTSQTDASGRTTSYEYDGLGRLIRTRDEQGRILSQQQYHYAGH